MLIFNNLRAFILPTKPRCLWLWCPFSVLSVSDGIIAVVVFFSHAKWFLICVTILYFNMFLFVRPSSLEVRPKAGKAGAMD